MLKAQIRPQGGIHPDSHKQLTAQQDIRTLEMPRRLILPLKQHAGAPALPVVKVGDEVSAEQLLARGNGRFSVPIHAPLAGTVTAIDGGAIQLKVSQEQTLQPPLRRDASLLEPMAMMDLIEAAGIVGMGGAMFPTADKLRLALKHPIDTLIINGSECEPYLTCDDRLMQEQGEQILGGIRYLMHITGATAVFIGIEENKPEALQHMDELCADEPAMEVVALPALYPMGSEKQLIQALCGREVPSGKLSAEMGILVNNVATCIAVFNALRFGRPLTHRVLTVTGEAIEQPGNVLVPIGMPLSEIINQCGGLKSTPARMVFGGPMMGKAVTDLHAPVTKGTSGILLLTEAELPRRHASACVRCGRCVAACPMHLTPLQLATDIRSDKLDKASECGLSDCLLCGSCAYVCPAAIPLTDYFDWGKQQLNRERLAKQKADATRAASEARRARLAQEAAERAAAKAAKPARGEGRGEGRRSSRRTTQEAS